MFIGGTDLEAETPVFWPPHAKSWLTGKDSDAGRNWGQEEKGTTEDEMAGWHHRLNRQKFEQALEFLVDRVAWRAAVQGVRNSWTWLSDWTQLIFLTFNHSQYYCNLLALFFLSFYFFFIFLFFFKFFKINFILFLNFT